MRLRHEQLVETIDAFLDGDSIVVRRDDGREIQAQVLARDVDRLVFRIDRQVHRARLLRQGRELYLHLEGRTVHFHWLDEEEEEDLESGLTDPVVRAPMPGKIIELLVEVGARVEAGAAVIRVEAMKMEVDLTASVSGTVDTIHVKPGELVAPEAALVTIQPREESSTP